MMKMWMMMNHHSVSPTSSAGMMIIITHHPCCCYSSLCILSIASSHDENRDSASLPLKSAHHRRRYLFGDVGVLDSSPPRRRTPSPAQTGKCRAASSASRRLPPAGELSRRGCWAWAAFIIVVIVVVRFCHPWSLSSLAVLIYTCRQVALESVGDAGVL